MNKSATTKHLENLRMKGSETLITMVKELQIENLELKRIIKEAKWVLNG